MKKKISLLTICFFFSASLLFCQNWQSYPFIPANSFLNFPEDDGYHPDPKTETEWWYINMNLIGSAPDFKKYSVIVVYFRFANMRLFNIACESDSSFKNSVIQQPFQQVFNFQAGHWELTYTKAVPNPINDYSRWTYLQDGKPYSYIFHTEDPVNNNGLDITVISNRTPMVVGANGYIALGDQGDSSYYYSYSNMKVTGFIKYKAISDSITSGIAWIDRQYGPFTVGINSDNQYEWFSLQLDKPGTILGVPQSPHEFNIWQIFSDSSSVPYKAEWRLVSALYPDDFQDTSSSFIFERTGYWFDPGEGKYYSQGWRFINPEKDITVDMVAPVKDQLVNVILFRFWEGGINLKGVIEDEHVDGVGFAEIVAGHDFQITVPSIPMGLISSSLTDHYSLAWQASSPGTYPIGGYRIFRSKSNNGYWKYIGSTTNLTFNDYSASMDTAYFYAVTSFDNQTATSASKYSSPAWTSGTGEKESDFTRNSLHVYPNPVIDGTTIQFTLKEKDFILIELYDLPGKKIHTIVKSELISGNHSIKVNSEKLSKGTYLIKVHSNNSTQIKKIVIM